MTPKLEQLTLTEVTEEERPKNFWEGLKVFFIAICLPERLSKRLLGKDD